MTGAPPKEPEAEAARGVGIGPEKKRLGAAGAALVRGVGVRAVLITRGGDGMALFEPGQPPLHIPIYGSDEVADVTGAGDTVIATFTLALAARPTPAEAPRRPDHGGGTRRMEHATATGSADQPP